MMLSSQRNESGHNGFFYIENEVNESIVKYNISQNPLDTSLNTIFRKLGTVHVLDVVRTVMVKDYIKINLITLYLKKNPQKSFWEAEIEYFYKLPLNKEKKHGRQYIAKWFGYNYVFINAITGKVIRKKFKQTSIVCY